VKAHPSYIFASATRILFFLINIFAVYITLRGHNLPGGGFIGGLITAISLILLRLAIGLEEVLRIIRIDPVYVGAAGLMMSALTSAAPMFFGHAFLEHFDVHLHHVPLLGDLNLGTPLAFDLGVYFVVVGVTTKIIFVLGRSTQGYSALMPEEECRYSSSVEIPIEEDAPAATLSPEHEAKAKEAKHAT
jgi:multisubunit Na+/H+ antiporter MnhB subunit